MCLQIFSQISLSVFSWSWTVLHSIRGDDVYFLLWLANFSLCKILPLYVCCVDTQRKTNPCSSSALTNMKDSKKNLCSFVVVGFFFSRFSPLLANGETFLMNSAASEEDESV